MPNGSLHDRLCDNIREPFSWKRRLAICIRAAYGLHYLHTGAKRTIVHRDVKTANILLDQNWVPKLSDLGLSLKGPHSMSKPRPIPVDKLVGTLGYIAPECTNLTNLTEKCDVFSFGMVLIAVVCAGNPVTKWLEVVWGGEHEHCQGSSYENSPSQVDVNKSGSVSLRVRVSEGVSQTMSEHLQLSSHVINYASWIYNIVRNGKADEILDPFLIGKFAPECWKIFMEIAERCLLFEPKERPSIGEVEMELEHALALQEEADQTNPSGNYSLLPL
ncbi:hypothetical protein L6164_006660 [Bauhinia variegata]|uniref:Uncharacterized protein n=1 Tax=Bauhinia variegata TaxID=167791 RepID=A0ACB9PV28_BAUVA|nr:hypothetical protein L6164_006660 [Bauhinia variegata]